MNIISPISPRFQYVAIYVLAVLFALPLFSQQSSDNVNLLIHLDEYPQQGYNDCWGYTAPDGREYALLGVRNGTSIVDITDAVNAVEVAFIGSPSSLWKDIKTYQHYAYAVTEASSSVQIIDLSNLPESASLVASPDIFSTNPHNIYIDEDAAILYGAEDFNFDQSCRIFSLEDPLAPQFLTAIAPDCHDMFAQNGLLFIAEGVNGTFSIYDVTDPASPVLVNRTNIPSAGYVHNVWASEDNSIIMTTEETTGKTAKVWDVQSLPEVTYIDDYLAPNGLAHNAHLRGGYSYLSHYGSGLRIIDVSNTETLTEAGFYDTADDWGAFPFFNSGKVLISDFDDGLYVVSFDPIAAPTIVNSLESLDFGTIPAGTSESLTFELSNGGLTELVVESISSLSEEFSADPGEVTLLPGESQMVTVTFEPQEAGEFSSAIRILSNGASRPSLAITVSGAAEPSTGIDGTSLPEGFHVSRNYPNPFNPSTTIEYRLPASGEVALAIYNATGQRVRTLVDQTVSAGTHQVTWNGRDDAGNEVSSGMYLYIFESGNHRSVNKMVLMK